MKHRYYLILMLGMPAAVSCDDFLTRLPQDQLTPETYFTTETECQLFTNEFYNLLPGGDGVYGETDDYIIPLELSNEVIGNRTVPSTSSAWNWDRLRDINFFLQHSNQCEDENVRLEYEGLARFFRAYFYFDKVKRFGDVPWVDRPLAAEDPELYKGRDDRKVVMQHILEDINFAIDNLPSTKNVYRITRWTALALKSRIFLFEGTFRKYHGLGDWESCLDEAISAGEIFVNTSGYTLYTTGDTPYRDLFTLLESDQSEIILSRAYTSAIGLVHDSNGRFTSISMGRHGIAKDVVNMYLMSDGTRFTDKSGFETMDFYEECQDRDPRLAQTIRTPGYTRIGSSVQLPPDMAATMTGYQIIKYVGESRYDSYNTSENDLPIFRTAEVYLNLAEAKAELNELTEDVWNKTIKPLRERAGVKSIYPSEADPYMVEYFQNQITDPYILEVRRERGIELTMENSRFDDIIRWHQGELFARPWMGIWIEAVDTPLDLNSDNVPETIVSADGSLTSTLNILPIDGASEAGHKLSEGTRGNILPSTALQRNWHDYKYLKPIPTTAIQENPNLTQNPGWEK